MQRKRPFRVLICYDDDADDTLEALKDFEAARVRDRNGAEPRDGGRTGPSSRVSAKATRPRRSCGRPTTPSMPASSMRWYREYRNGCHVVSAGRFIEGGCMVGAPWLKSLLVRSSAFTLYYLARLPGPGRQQRASPVFPALAGPRKDRIVGRFRVRNRTAGQVSPARLEYCRGPRGMVREDDRPEPLQGHPLASGIPAMVYLRLSRPRTCAGGPIPSPETRPADAGPEIPGGET